MTSEVLYLLDVETGFKQLREIGVAEQVRMDVKVKHHRYIAVALPEFARHLPFSDRPPLNVSPHSAEGIAR